MQVHENPRSPGWVGGWPSANVGTGLLSDFACLANVTFSEAVLHMPRAPRTWVLSHTQVSMHCVVTQGLLDI